MTALVIAFACVAAGLVALGVAIGAYATRAVFAWRDRRTARRAARRGLLA